MKPYFSIMLPELDLDFWTSKLW